MPRNFLHEPGFIGADLPTSRHDVAAYLEKRHLSTSRGQSRRPLLFRQNSADWDGSDTALSTTARLPFSSSVNTNRRLGMWAHEGPKLGTTIWSLSLVVM
ncbi:MAG: hypothetical protein KVP17_002404 [Porospora cf. gigantea B]|uniref:uncharacterized protein n=1 Tax=Porospora cf. gigantea B TaxID=2853592 RepID=UPI003571EF7E|nr:MAG: hypothetical protein KVP17_002404 [Porospora cf. gigantea B]